MTQAITTQFNNPEEMVMVQADAKREAGYADVNRSSDFARVFDKHFENNRSLGDLKNKFKDVEQSENLANFKEILAQATDEANVETSLDLTLARDINEIITQLKDAVKSAEESIDKNSDSEIQDGFTVLDELLTLEGEVSQENLLLAESAELEEKEPDEESINIAITQVADLLTLRLDGLREFDGNSGKISESFTEMPENVLNNAVEESANLGDENSTLSQELDSILDEDMLKELNLESMDAQSDTADGESLMQNQTPEEYGLKAMINQDVEVFDLKIDKAMNIQNVQQAVQAKGSEVNSGRIIEQITKHMEALQNNQKVNIVLNPESLGKVNIQLLTTKEGLTAQFTVSTTEARDLLMKGLDGLKDSLISQGVSVDNVSVKLNDTQKSTYEQDWTEQDGSRGGNKEQDRSSRKEKEKGLFERMMAGTNFDDENGNV